MFVLWCACVKISAVAHTNTHSHAQENADVCKINRNTSPPPLLLLPLPKSHPRKINADSVFLFLLLSPQNVHLRASYLSRTEGSKERADSHGLLAALMHQLHCPSLFLINGSYRSIP